MILELDELYPAASLGAPWSFVGSKSNKRWVWFALCRRTRQVVACVVGGRGEVTCKQLWRSIPKPYQQGICYSDFWKACQVVLPKERHQAVGKDTGLTNHIERFNCTLRQRLSRFVRKTLSFSNSDEMHLACLHLFLHRYNLERASSIR